MSDKSNPSLGASEKFSGTDTSMSISGLADTGEITGIDDFTTDLSRSDLSGQAGAKKRQLKNQYERKQLLHDLQLLKIEVSQKSLVIDNLKAQHMSKIEDLEDKLHDALHKKQILQARLENALAIQQDDAKQRHDQTQKELKVILDRQRELEQNNRRLQAKATNIKAQLQKDNIVNENQYVELKSRPSDDLTVAEYFSVRLYEGLQPLKIEADNLRTQRDKLSTDVAQLSHKLHTYEQDILQERRRRSHAEVQLQALASDLENARKALDERSGKAQRFDSVLSERDRLDKSHAELMKKHSYLEAEHSAICKELSELKKERDSMEQSTNLLRQDKGFLTKNLAETSAKLETLEDNLRRTQDQLEQVKSAREELYEKYAASRDEARLVYERRLQTELDRIRLQTESELERLRSDSRESYERENRNLREARDTAMQDRDQLAKLRDEAEKRCEVYANEVKALESSIDARLSDYQNEVRIKAFELDRLQLVHEETCKNLDKAQESNERFSRKLEVVTSDYAELQRTTAAEDAELRVTVRDLRTRLKTYEQIEKEMDDIVMQAAEVEVSSDRRGEANEAERVLFSYGYGANIPTTAKQRMKQSVHLARRVLQLEKINTGLQSEIQRKDEESQDLSKQLANANQLLEETRQPYSYLIESMRKRDEELEKHRKILSNVEDRMDKLKLENDDLRETKRVMSSDLERLLNHRQEMAVLKRTIAGMVPPQSGFVDDGNLLRSLASRRRSTPARDDLTTKGQGAEESDPRFPSPLVFTRQDKRKFNKERHRKLKELNDKL